jgi:hypothetical protein
MRTHVCVFNVLNIHLNMHLMYAFNTPRPSMSIQFFPIVFLGTNEIIGIKFACFFCCPYYLNFMFPMFFLTSFKLDYEVPLIKLPLYSNQTLPKCQILKKKNKLTSYPRMSSSMYWTLKQWCARQHVLEIYFLLKFGYKIFEPNFTLSLMGVFLFWNHLNV